jgi:hypothetical protein
MLQSCTLILALEQFAAWSFGKLSQAVRGCKAVSLQQGKRPLRCICVKFPSALALAYIQRLKYFHQIRTLLARKKDKNPILCKYRKILR